MQYLGRGGAGVVLGSNQYAFKFAKRAETHQEFQKADEIAKRLNPILTFFAVPSAVGVYELPEVAAICGEVEVPTDLPEDHVAFAMERVKDIPSAFRQKIAEILPARFHEGIQRCQLYAGDCRDLRLINAQRALTKGLLRAALPPQVPLTMAEMELLGLPVDEIVANMGEFLAALHYVAGYDGVDVEYVLGGGQAGHECYVCFDFEGVERWSTVDDLVESIAAELVHPFPWPGDPRWNIFETAYLRQAACSCQTSTAEELLSKLKDKAEELRLEQEKEEDITVLFEEHMEAAAALIDGSYNTMRCHEDYEVGPVHIIFQRSHQVDQVAVLAGVVCGSTITEDDILVAVSALDGANGSLVLLGDDCDGFVSALAAQQKAVALVVDENSFIYKIAGAAADAGLCLDDIAAEIQAVMQHSLSSFHKGDEVTSSGNEIAVMLNGPLGLAAQFAVELQLEATAHLYHCFLKPDLSATVLQLTVAPTEAPFW